MFQLSKLCLSPTHSQSQVKPHLLAIQEEEEEEAKKLKETEKKGWNLLFYHNHMCVFNVLFVFDKQNRSFGKWLRTIFFLFFHFCFILFVYIEFHRFFFFASSFGAHMKLNFSCVHMYFCYQFKCIQIQIQNSNKRI